LGQSFWSRGGFRENDRDLFEVKYPYANGTIYRSRELFDNSGAEVDESDELSVSDVAEVLLELKYDDGVLLELDEENTVLDINICAPFLEGCEGSWSLHSSFQTMRLREIGQIFSAGINA
jgi:hypothetical protein